jgi:hypothetical protein
MTSRGHAPYSLREEGKATLDSVRQRCVVIGIYGVLRRGKSWLLDYIMQEPDHFKASNRHSETKVSPETRITGTIQ